MTNLTPAAGQPAAGLFTRGQTSWRGGWATPAGERTLEHERLENRARGTDATGQLLRCFPRWTRALEYLIARALQRLACNEPVDPNDADVWRSRDAHAQAVLHRHGHGSASATRLSSTAITTLIDGQARADRDAGLDGAPSPSQRACSTSPYGGRMNGCRSRSRTRKFGPTRSISGARSPDGSASTSTRRTICRGGSSLIPTSSTRRICAAGGSARTPGWRSPASSSPRSERSSGRSACSSSRRCRRATGGS